jgi:hypothetical protein
VKAHRQLLTQAYPQGRLGVPWVADVVLRGLANSPFNPANNVVSASIFLLGAIEIKLSLALAGEI